MDFSVFFTINYLAVVVAAGVYFMMGSVWYSGLFGRAWLAELKKHNVTIHAPSTAQLRNKMIIAFVLNFITAVAVAWLVKMTESTTAMSGLMLGIVITIGFAATTIASMFNWEGRSVKLFLIDIGYPALGIIASAILLSVWQ